MEVIWGNRLKPGDYKYIGSFPHFVADAGDERVSGLRSCMRHALAQQEQAP